MANDGYSADHIVYTIYEEEEGSPKLYSAMGVADLYTNEKEGASTESSYVPGDPERFVKIDTTLTGTKQKLTGTKNHNNIPHFLYERYITPKENINEAMLKGLNWQTNFYDYQDHTESDGDVMNYYMKKFYVQITNYQGMATSTRPANFIFQVVYANSSIESLTLNGNALTFDGVVPTSGSIFEVCGYNDKDVFIKKGQAEDRTPWYVVALGFLWAACEFLPYVGGLFKGAKWAKKAIKMLILL